jgi:phage portal protein BeeE
MSVWRNVINYLSGGINRNRGTQNPDPSSRDSESAVPVTMDTALQLSTVWACSRIITESIGQCPVEVFKKSDDGVLTPFPDHPVARLMRHKVNRWQNWQQFMECIAHQFSMTGNDYSVKQFNFKKEIMWLTHI